MSSQNFKEELLKYIFKVDHLADIPTYTLTEDDWKTIDQRVEEKYGRDEWNYGKNPGFDYYQSRYFPGTGTVAFNYSVEDGRISNFQTYGDMSFGNPEELDQAMLGQEYNEAGVKAGLEAGDYKKNIGDVDINDLVQMLAPQN